MVLSAEERAKGFVRPVRLSYVHVGAPAPKNLRDLTDEERELCGYVKYEAYGEDRAPISGRYRKRADLDRISNGCGRVTTMARSIAETYAEPWFLTGMVFFFGPGLALQMLCALNASLRGIFAHRLWYGLSSESAHVTGQRPLSGRAQGLSRISNSNTCSPILSVNSPTNWPPLASMMRRDAVLLASQPTRTANKPMARASCKSNPSNALPYPLRRWDSATE